MNPFGSESDKARAIILEILSQGRWYAPHETYREIQLRGCDLSPDSSSARQRDLKKPKYGRHPVVKRRRAGTDYYEYQIQRQEEKAA